MEKKIAMVEDLRRKIDSSKIVIFTDYQGLLVSEMTILRRLLRKNKAEYKVVKNTLLKRAVPDSESISGPTALVLGYEDEVLPAKVIYEFAKKFEKPVVLGGIFNKQIVSALVLKEIASLPSREILIASVMAGMNAPIAGLHGVLSGIIRKLVYTVEAIKKAKEEVK